METRPPSSCSVFFCFSLFSSLLSSCFFSSWRNEGRGDLSACSFILFLLLLIISCLLPKIGINSDSVALHSVPLHSSILWHHCEDSLVDSSVNSLDVTCCSSGKKWVWILWLTLGESVFTFNAILCGHLPLINCLCTITQSFYLIERVCKVCITFSGSVLKKFRQKIHRCVQQRNDCCHICCFKSRNLIPLFTHESCCSTGENEEPDKTSDYSQRPQGSSF